MVSHLAMLITAVALAGDAPPLGEKAAEKQPRVVTPFEDIRVDLAATSVEVRAWVCLNAGFLEQIACSPGTREHESLLVVRARPSNIHAALLMAGVEAGAPGRWIVHPEEEKVELIPPRGDRVDVLVRYRNSDGEEIEEAIRRWIRDHAEKQKFPDAPWVFGGSLFRPNPEWMEPEGGEHYVADVTGSIIGLVTFGDEVIGFSRVISDQAAVHEPEWMVNTERIPDVGTEVTLILRRFEEAEKGEQEGRAE
jgi:hypothetical protein